MTTSKDRRKVLKREYLERERAGARETLGLTARQLRSLRRELDLSIFELGMPCDHTLGRTEEWARQAGLDVARAVMGARANGGGCDCEVLYNVRPYMFGWEED